MACKRSAVRSRLAPPPASRFSATSPSSRGPGHRPFTAVTGVRIPLGTPPIPNGREFERFLVSRMLVPDDHGLSGPWADGCGVALSVLPANQSDLDEGFTGLPEMRRPR